MQNGVPLELIYIYELLLIYMHFCQKGGLSFLEVSKSSLLPAGLEKKNRANACSAISFMYSATLQSAGRATILFGVTASEEIKRSMLLGLLAHS
jgi:hypothetical protein